MRSLDQPSRRRLLVIGGAAVGGALTGCGPSANRPAEPPPPPAPSPPGSETGVPATTPPSGPVVTVLGDSITAGLGLPAAQALPAQLQAALDRANAPATVRGAGVSGDTSAGGLARLAFSVQDDTAVCLLALGGNDLLQGVEPARLRANIDAAVAALQARDIAVVLAGVSPPPAASGAYGREFAAAFATVAQARGVAGFAPNLLEGIGPALRQPDGLHPNAEGVRLIAERLAPLIVAALPPGR